MSDPLFIGPNGESLDTIDPVSADQMPPQQSGLLGSIGHELLGGAAGAAGALAQVGATLGSKIGGKGAGALPQAAANWLFKQAQSQGAQSEFAQSIGDVNGVGSALGYGAHVLLNGAPVMAALIGADFATGGAAVPVELGAGASLLRPFAARAIEGGTARLVAAGMEETAAREAATSAVSQAIGQGIARVGAGTAATYPFALGDMLAQQQQETGHTDLLSAAALALPDAALNTVGPESLLKYGFPSGVAAGGAKRLASAIGAGAAGQAAVGASQQALSAANSASVGGQGFANLGANMLAGGLGGALVGGAFGAVGGMGVHNAPGMGDDEIAAALNRQAQVQAVQADQQAARQSAAQPTPYGQQGEMFAPDGLGQNQQINPDTWFGAPPTGTAAAPGAQGPAPQQLDMFAPQGPQQAAPSAPLALPPPASPLRAPGTDMSTIHVDQQGNAMPPAAPAAYVAPSALPPVLPPHPGAAAMPTSSDIVQAAQARQALAALAPGQQREMFPGDNLGAPAQGPGQAEMFPGQQLGNAPAQQPAGQGDLFSPAARPGTAPAQPDLIAHTPADAAATLNIGPRQLLVQMRAAASDGQKLPAASGTMVKLASNVGAALQRGDIPAAQAAIKATDSELQTATMSSKSLDQHIAALDVAKGAVASMQAHLQELAADQHLDERDEAATIAQSLPGKASQDLIRRVTDRHTTGAATIQDVRDVGAALAARRFPAARNLVEQIEARDENPTGQAAGQDAREQPAAEAIAQAIPADRPAPADEPAGSGGASGATPEGQGVVEAASPEASAPAEKVESDAAPVKPGPELTPDQMHEQLADAYERGHLGLAEHDRLAGAVDDGRLDQVRGRLAELDAAHHADVTRWTAVADEGLKQGAISPKDHARIMAGLASDKPEQFTAAKALIGQAQRNIIKKTPSDVFKFKGGEAPTRGLSPAEAQSAIDKVALGPAAPRVNVVNSAHELPDQIRDAAAASGVAPKGIYHQGTVHIISSAHRDAADVRATLFHEALGHAGLERQFGEKLDGVLSDIYRTNMDVRRAADAWMAENPHMYRGEPDLQARATEEVLAHMQEGAEKSSYGVKAAMARALGVIRAFGRRLGLVHQYSDGDVRYVLQRSAEAARTTPRPVAADAAGAPKYRATSIELPKFQRPTKDEMKSAAETARLDVAIKSTKALLAAMTNRQMAERFEKHLPSIRTVVDLMARASVRKQQLMDLGVSPTDALRTLSAAERDSVSRLLLDGRLNQIDARKPGNDYASRYAALSPAGRAAYSETLNYFSTIRDQMISSLKQVAQDISGEHAQAADGLREIVREAEKLPVYVPLMRQGDYLVNATHADGRYIHEAFKAPGQAVRRARELKKQGFDTSTFEADTEGRLASQGLEGFYGRYASAVEARIAKAEAAGDPEMADALRSSMQDAREIMLQLLPEGAALKRTISAKGIEGYMTDMLKVTAIAAKRQAQLITNIEHGHAIRSALDEMRVTAKAKSSDDFTLSQVYKQIKNNYLNSQKVDDTPIQNFLNQLGYVYQLGGSVAFSTMHAMQTPLVTQPMLGGKFGERRSAAELTKAAAETSKLYYSKKFQGFKHGDDITQYGKTAGEKLMLQHLDNQGHFSGTDAQTRLNAVINDGKLSKAARGVMALASYFPHHTERYNRIITALAAYRMNEAMHVNPENLEAYNRFRENFAHDSTALAMTPQQHASMRIAEDMTLNSHIDYNTVNAPGLFSSNKYLPNKLIFQFKKYEQGMLYNLIVNAKDALNSNLSGKERLMAAKTLGGLLATHGVVTGVMGMPGFGLAVGLYDLYNEFFTDHDTTWDGNTEFRNWMAKELGPETGAVFDRGMMYLPVIRDVLPADITDRVGMGDLFSVGNVTDGISKDTFLEGIGSQLTGATGALFSQFADAYSAARSGNTWRATEDLLPKALRDVAKADRFYTYGVNSESGQPILASTTVQDDFMQALGFRPQDVQQAESAREAVYVAKQEIQDRHTEITQQFTRALAEGESLGPIMDEVQKFNDARIAQGQSGYLITGKVLRQAAQNYAMNLALLDRGVSLRGKDYVSFRRLTAFAGNSEGQSRD